MTIQRIDQLSDASQWIFVKFEELTTTIDSSIAEYELSKVVSQIYVFLWDYYADWYVEYLKTDPSQLYFAKELFLEFIIVCSPFIPFEAEVLWREYFGRTDVLAHYVHTDEFVRHYSPFISSTSVKEFDQIVECIKKIRSIRGLFGIEPAIVVSLESDNQQLYDHEEFIFKVAKAKLTIPSGNMVFTSSSQSLSFGIDINAYVKDRQKELARTDKVITNIKNQISSLLSQLNNQDFVANAPEHILEEKKSQLKQREDELKEQEAKINYLNSATI